ncbi:envelope-like protein, partial [Trifolium pratense]
MKQLLNMLILSLKMMNSQRTPSNIKRRFVVERNLSEDFLQCQELVDLINEAGLMKTVTGLGKCYEMLTKEFLVNIQANCGEPLSPKYKKIFVRGRCVDFSPAIINQHMGRCADNVRELEVAMKDICKTLTGNLVKAWQAHCKEQELLLTMVLIFSMRQFCMRDSDWSLDFRMFEGTHVVDIAAPSVRQPTGAMTRRQMVANLKEVSKSLCEKKDLVDRVIQALELEEPTAAEVEEGPSHASPIIPEDEYAGDFYFVDYALMVCNMHFMAFYALILYGTLYFAPIL